MLQLLRRRPRRWVFSLWPPFLGAGIRVKYLRSDWKAIDVEMDLRWWNRNFVNTHYGGSLYSMADPFYMLMLIANLGPDYVVWDKAASIRFRRPGKGKMRAAFRLSEDQIEMVREALKSAEKVEPTFTVEIRDESGALIAEVQKLLYVRKKNGANQ
jgi:uncharacterized protein DUF4442